jgi:hypothetical protein
LFYYNNNNKGNDVTVSNDTCAETDEVSFFENKLGREFPQRYTLKSGNSVSKLIKSHSSDYFDKCRPGENSGDKTENKTPLVELGNILILPKSNSAESCTKRSAFLLQLDKRERSGLINNVGENKTISGVKLLRFGEGSSPRGTDFVPRSILASQASDQPPGTVEKSLRCETPVSDDLVNKEIQREEGKMEGFKLKGMLQRKVRFSSLGKRTSESSDTLTTQLSLDPAILATNQADDTNWAINGGADEPGDIRSISRNVNPVITVEGANLLEQVVSSDDNTNTPLLNPLRSAYPEPEVTQGGNLIRKTVTYAGSNNVKDSLRVTDTINMENIQEGGGDGEFPGRKNIKDGDKRFRSPHWRNKRLVHMYFI